MLKPQQVNAADYAAIFYAGGHGTMWDFPCEEKLQAIARDIYEAGGVVAAVCHGPAGLVNIKLSSGDYLVRGKWVAAFTRDEEQAVELDKVIPFFLSEKLESRGAVHVPAPNWTENVITDDRLVTGQNPASAHGVGLAIRELLQ